MKKIQYTLIAITTAFFFACGGNETSTENMEDEMTEESHEGHDHAHSEESGELPPPVVPEGAKVYFGNIEDGAVLTSPISIQMTAEGVVVHPAGELMDGTGHHHIIVDEGPTPIGVVVPADESHIHFGGGQIETELVLEPGSHTLTLQFADGLHRSYGEALSSTITIEVEAAE